MAIPTIAFPTQELRAVTACRVLLSLPENRTGIMR